VRAKNGYTTAAKTVSVSSMIHVLRCQQMYKPTSSASGREQYALFTLEDDDSTGTLPFFNVESCQQINDFVAPWSEANYGDTGIQARGRLRARARVT